MQLQGFTGLKNVCDVLSRNEGGLGTIVVLLGVFHKINGNGSSIPHLCHLGCLLEITNIDIGDVDLFSLCDVVIVGDNGLDVMFMAVSSLVVQVPSNTVASVLSVMSVMSVVRITIPSASLSLSSPTVTSTAIFMVVHWHNLCCVPFSFHNNVKSHMV